ncbi:ClpXP protease specificity-enhancing factor [Tepidimonas taiwanensis]|uniref:ClpXP protease specificity-enhancing factor n=1 Tax=Tepidimonas taiwanensis TaxID=307486 RepID=UPI000734C097|nr:ClpXP protease specificity-enhancing factor [Tepidimonas taiwanensis]
MDTDAGLPSTRPYLIRALHEWCTDGGFTPYIVVAVDERVQVPREYVRDGQIVLNVGYEATSGLQIGNDFVTFKARFGGVAREVVIPIDHVIAIYARENGQGMAFPAPAPAEPAADPDDALSAAGQKLHAVDTGDGPDKPSGGGGKRPALKRIK